MKGKLITLQVENSSKKYFKLFSKEKFKSKIKCPHFQGRRTQSRNLLGQRKIIF